MANVRAREFYKALAFLLGKYVKVITVNGKSFLGFLKGYHPDSLSVCLDDAKDNEGNVLPRVVLSGKIVAEIVLSEKPFDLKGLAQELEKMFPLGEVKFYEDPGLITVLGRVKVTSQGVEGTGPTADRIRQAFERFVETSKKEET